LRRDSKFLQHPPAEFQTVEVHLSAAERALYDKILRDCEAEFDRIVSTGASIKRFNAMFITIMKLRRLCNHGTMDIQSPEDENLIFSDPEAPLCEFCSGGDEDDAPLLEGLDSCPQCSRDLQSVQRNQAWEQDVGSDIDADMSTPSPSPLVPSEPQATTPVTRDSFSSKLTAVANDIEQFRHSSKR
jgi:SWI/SNF-related matrix-associated actin-dependent regulator of chromatin subfamily A3